MRGILALLLIFIISCENEDGKDGAKLQEAQEQSGVGFHERVIYGEDNRRDLFEVQDADLLRVADSTVALVKSRNIQVSGLESLLSLESYGDGQNLCLDEPFYEQSTAAFCSGFLVGKDLIVTAGHCITSTRDCSSTKFVFGFSIKQAGDSTPASYAGDQVYSCERIVSRELNSQTLQDYAVIKLDREVVGHKPLKIRRQGSVSVGQALVVIGHPSGLPTKIAGGGRVRQDKGNYLIADLDTYGGNSGSAVINRQSLEVEGILVRGARDFVFESGCRRSNRCREIDVDSGSCGGEGVTKITELSSFIPEVVEPEDPELGELSISSGVLNIDIPDNDSRGVDSQIEVLEAVQGRSVQIEVDIVHTWRGDLIIEIESPDGEVKTLVNKQGGYRDNIQGVYGVSLSAQDDLTSLANSSAGVWSLKVSDNLRRDLGRLVSWEIHFK